MTALAPLGLPLGYSVIPVRYLRPYQERERSRDGSCHNLSAAKRNKERRDEASKVWVDHRTRTIYGPPHVVAKLWAMLL